LQKTGASPVFFASFCLLSDNAIAQAIVLQPFAYWPIASRFAKKYIVYVAWTISLGHAITLRIY
jgi:hypothetical protein